MAGSECGLLASARGDTLYTGKWWHLDIQWVLEQEAGRPLRYAD